MNKRDLYGFLTFQRLYKIGISVDVKKRLHQINSDVSGGAFLLVKYEFNNPRKVEKYLHEYFSDSRTTLKHAGPNAGKTEWFYLSVIELLILLCLVFIKRHRLIVNITAFLAFWCWFLITIILHKST